jgi:alkylhydroperoxidase family enzyme
LKPGEITQFDYKELQKNNFDDKAISEIVQVISYFNYINRVADGLGLEPEEFIDEKGYKR